MNVDLIVKELTQLRNTRTSLIHVSNTEWYSLFKDEIRNSIAIEGIFTNRTDLIDVLERNKRANKQKAAAILGYFESASTMYDYAVNQHKEKEFFLRISDIKQIHTLLMRYEKEMGFYIGELGDFRKMRAEVTLSTFMPISEYYVRPAMELLIKWVNHHLKKKTYNKILLAAIAHAWFESIHPFRDGNGRSGRILLSYLLIGCGLVNVAIKGISKMDREQYYNALEKADDVFENLHRRIEQGKSFNVKAVDMMICLDDFNEMMFIITTRLNDAANRLKRYDIHYMNKEAQLPLSDLAHIYNYSPDYLRNLINRGKLKGKKKGKTWYVRVQDMANYVEHLDPGTP
ncbi:MAG: Fic family protein [Deltaproteobacteria bacterium]|nr:Fic family protein [Deltaproteobacteria bacterium]